MIFLFELLLHLINVVADDTTKTNPETMKTSYFCGHNISQYSKNTQLLMLVLGHMAFAITFSLLQEKVFLIEGFHHAGFMTLLTVFTYTICAIIEQLVSGDTKRKAKLIDYIPLAICTFLGNYLTNYATARINYTTRLIIKSAKVIPVMFVGVIFLRKRYKWHQYVTVLVLVTGISLFVLGDASTHGSKGKFSWIGVSILCLAVFVDAITSNYEERWFFQKRGASHSEVMLYSSLISIFISLVTLKSSGELTEAIDFASEHPEVYYMIFAFSAVNYVSVVSILLLIANFGSASSEIVKSSRKFITMLCSIVFYAKPFLLLHFFGLALFVVSLVFGSYMRRHGEKHTYQVVKQEDPDAVEKSLDVIVDKAKVIDQNGHMNGHINGHKLNGAKMNGRVNNKSIDI